MKLHETGIPGARVIEMEPHEDERGFFARTWSAEEMRVLGLDSAVTECSISYNAKQATLRGMHYQVAPHEETKLVTCIRGRIFDAIVDLRPDSDSYLKTFVTELSLEDGKALHVPAGVAHGFITLQDDSYVHYQIGGAYEPGAARGVRWNDPALDIDWPFDPAVISERDRAFEDFEP